MMMQTYALRNAHGSSVRFLNYGGAVQQINVPDRDGRMGNVVLGFADPQDYLAPQPYFGALVGRYSGRITNARFPLDGKTFQLSANQGKHSIAGGFKGFDKAWWQVEECSPQTARLTYISADGEEGFPGNLTTVVTYSLTDENAFRIDYEATTDKPTVLNLTNHSYFNLGGDGSGTMENHILTIASSRVLEVDGELMPTGNILPVDGTPLDFRQPTAIGARIRAGHPLIRHGRGYDHSYLLEQGDGLALAAQVYESRTGRRMAVYTTEPSLAFYTGNFLDGTLTGAAGSQYRQGDAFTLEPRHLPDSPNHDAFPSTVLRPGAVFRATTVYRFSTDSKESVAAV